MTYKTIVISALLAGSMHHAWGMENENGGQSANGNNNPIVRTEGSEIARLAAAIKTLNLNVENMNKQLNDRMMKMEKKIDTVEKKVGQMTESSDHIRLYDLKKEIRYVQEKVDEIHRKTK